MRCKLDYLWVRVMRTAKSFIGESMKTVRVTFGLLCMLALVAMTTIGCEKKEGGEKSEHQLDRTKEFVTVATDLQAVFIFQSAELSPKL